MKTKRLGIGVIGLSMGKNMLHINNHPNEFDSQVTAICDIRADLLQWTKDEFSGIKLATKNWQDVVTSKDVNIVGVFSPDHLHFEMVKAALENGKHVICTKPMVISLQEAKDTVNLVRKHNLKFLVGQTRRFVTHHQQVKDFYDSGKIGTALFAEASYVHGDVWTVFDRGAWRFEHPQDIIYGGACHPIDHLRWYFGDVDEVHCYGATSPVDLRYPQDKEINFTINLKFKSGLIARVLTLCGIHIPPGGHSGDIMPMEGVSIFGTKGSIVNYHAVYRENGDHNAPRQEVHFMKDDVKEDFDGKEYSGHRLSVFKYVREMEACIKNNTKPTVNEIEGAKCIAVCSACWESINKKTLVKVFNEF